MDLKQILKVLRIMEDIGEFSKVVQKSIKETREPELRQERLLSDKRAKRRVRYYYR